MILQLQKCPDVLSVETFHIDPSENLQEIILHTTQSYKFNFCDLLMLINVVTKWGSAEKAYTYCLFF